MPLTTGVERRLHALTYDRPEHPDVRIDTTCVLLDSAAEQILAVLRHMPAMA
jgi:adenylylsulfate kinase-like enzyme